MVQPSTRQPGLLLILLGTLACTNSAPPVAPSPTVLQAAAVAFIARANGDKGPCVHVAGGPDEMTRGRVTDRLQDPPPEFVTLLKKRGSTVQAFSACSLGERDKLTYAIGWPRATRMGFEVNADRLCGARCGEGTLILVKNVGTEWRAVQAETIWTE